MSKRKSFIVHHDSLEVINKLTDEQAGKLLKAIKAYQLGEDFEMDLMTDLVFTPFKSQFIRDDEKYQNIVNRNKNNGLKGGRPKTQTNPREPNKPSGLSGNPKEPKKADSKSDSKSDSKEPSRFAEFWSMYGKKTGKDVCERKFNKLKESDVNKIFEVLPSYIASTPDVQYRKNPSTWLNQKCWEDEIQGARVIKSPQQQQYDHEAARQREIEEIRKGLM